MAKKEDIEKAFETLKEFRPDVLKEGISDIGIGIEELAYKDNNFNINNKKR